MGELPWMMLELPTPPSCNTFMRKLGNRSPEVAKWIKQADHYYLVQKYHLTSIIGPFEAEFIFKRDRSDYHNREKVLFDWLQRVGLIQNDKLCEWRASGWGDAPFGVIVKLRPWMERS